MLSISLKASNATTIVINTAVIKPLYLLFFKNNNFSPPFTIFCYTYYIKNTVNYILRLSTPAAAVAVGTGVLMKKFSFGDEEKIRTSKKLIRGSLFSYGFILCIDLILSLIKTLLT